MHVAQIMLVEADTLEDAMSDVQAKLDDLPQWSDWHNASAISGGSFAGRWQGEFFGEKNENDALRYSDDPALAENVIFEQLSTRKLELSMLRERVEKSGYDPMKVEYDPEASGWNMDAIALQRMIGLLENDWNSDSAIYDLHDWTASLASFRKRVADAPEKQFLVAVDFHF
jgi:hypothetical protein